MEFGFEDARMKASESQVIVICERESRGEPVEVLGCTDGDEGVGVGQGGEDADLVGVLKCCADGHVCDLVMSW